MTTRRDILVLGASAGGIDALGRFLGLLPADLDASVLLVLHLASDSPGLVPEMLGRRSRLPVSFATHGQPMRRGHAVLAPPDHHLLIETGERLAVCKGPRENRFRPAIDTLFRSAAVACGPRVVGALLTGWLDDGVAGLSAIKQCGGLILVQDPDDASVAEMPRRAIEALGDAIDGRYDIPGLAARMTAATRELAPEPVAVPRLLALENAVATRPDIALATQEQLGKPAELSCPDCGGPLRELYDPFDVERYRCHVGHSFTPRMLLRAQDAHVEQALWEAVRLMRERGRTLRRLSRGSVSPTLLESAETSDIHAATLEQLLLEISPHRAERTASETSASPDPPNPTEH